MKGIGLMFVVVGAFFAAATVASAETITTEESVVLENGETVSEVSQLTADAVTTVTGTTIKCKKINGWHGLKHPLFGYFYWKYILTIRWCWQSGGSLIVKTSNPWSPTYWRAVECCLQFSGWDFKGHTGLDIDGGANKSQYRVRAQGKFQQCFQLRNASLSKQSMSGPRACTTSSGGSALTCASVRECQQGGTVRRAGLLPRPLTAAGPSA